MPSRLIVLVLCVVFCDSGHAFGQEKLVVTNSEARTASEMRPYSETLEHTRVKIDMVPIPGGEFAMGSPENEPGRNPDEGPVHRVKIAPFWMAKFELTWEAYDVWNENKDIRLRKIKSRPITSRDKLADAVTRPTEPYTDMSFDMGRGKSPAICMTQHAARTYCKWLSAKTGRYYRLPTEAEWEYACRAGTTTAWYFGDDPKQLDEHAWHAGNSEETSHKVGQKKQNPWGLYDMHGNVAEWVLDQYVADGYSKRDTLGKPVENPLAIPKILFPRVVRGGGWDHESKQLRAAARMPSSEEWKTQDPQLPQSIWYHTDALSVGFRVVRPLTEPTDAEKKTKWDKTAPLQIDPPDGE